MGGQRGLFGPPAEERGGTPAAFDPSQVTVRQIEVAAAAPFIIKYHYAHACPTARLAFGLFRHNALVGVAVFNHGSGKYTITSAVVEIRHDEGLELIRLALLDSIGRNAETWFVARCLAAIERGWPHVKVVVSYADPAERHVGTIYQAGNWIYCGRAPDGKPRFILPDGKVLHSRTANSGFGTSGVAAVVQATGARAVMERGKHTYVMPMGDRRQQRWVRKRIRYMECSYPKDPLDAPQRALKPEWANTVSYGRRRAAAMLPGIDVAAKRNPEP